MLLAEYVFIWLFFVHSVTPSAYKDGDEELITNPREKKNTPSKTPQFNWKMNTTERISAGQTVYLHCQINNLGDRSVSWIRKSDLKILTIGDILYTEDQRFAPIHENGSDVWMLKVGKAELTMTFSLTVLDSRAFIQKSADLHVQIGSKLQLSCFVLRPSAPPNYVYWYRNEHVLNYSPSVDIRSQVFKDSIANGTEISQLTIDYVSLMMKIDQRQCSTGTLFKSSPITARKDNIATEPSFKVVDIFTKRQKLFTDGGIVKEAMTVVAETLFRDFKNKDEIWYAISNVQLSAKTMARRVCAMSSGCDCQFHLSKGKATPELQAVPGGMFCRVWGYFPRKLVQMAKSRENTTVFSFLAGGNQEIHGNEERG
ncbi:unnamed protein product [Lepeophtheirus salmonis]|uniref:(salmon louse) hypothetical protein n=1 Tax=Lepeophtheirus salmonis TaxID=72036 RepID=A0A7R8CVQ6_LEPSM|nr:unnamed protein product [Lepeophtheirus salmonis]CAF2914708.1 unnamed protein product [Lepeophtheirus salmonis]